VDGNTWSAYAIQDGESRYLRPPRRKRPNSTTCQSAGPATCRSDAGGQADHWELGSKAPQTLDAKLKEMIAVEVDWIGTIMPSPRNPDRRPRQRNGRFSST
jgi:hypothetical protein